MLNSRKIIPFFLLTTIFPPLSFSQQSTLAHIDERMPNQPKSLICGCEIIKNPTKLDLKSCSMEESNLILETIIPKEWFSSWMSNLGPNTYKENFNAASFDPILNAYFADKSYSAYKSSSGLVAGIPNPGFLGGCSININANNESVMAGAKLGIISRAALYLEMKYQAIIPPNQKQHFLDFAKKYPPTQWEIDRNEASFLYKGTWNPFISKINGKPLKKTINPDHRLIEENLNYLINRIYEP